MDFKKKMIQDELRTLHEKQYSQYKQKYSKMQLGFFNGNEILFIGQNPGDPTSVVNQLHIKNLESQNNFADFEKEYFKIIRESKIGEFINMVIDDWTKISFTNVVKIPTDNNALPSNELTDEFLPLLLEQIKALSPQLIVCLGKFAGSKFGLTNFKVVTKIKNRLFIMVEHPSFLVRTSNYEHSCKEIKNIISRASSITNKVTHVQSVFRERPMTYIWSRSGKNKVCVLLDETHPSYFYIDESELEKVSKFSGKLKSELIGVEKNHLTFDNKPVVKVSWQNISKEDFIIARELFDKTYESDVKYHDRVIIDNNFEYDKNQRIMYIDIETNRSLAAEIADKEIIAITLYDNFTKQYGVFCFHPEERNREERVDDCAYYWFNSEVAMLNKFIDIFKLINPDILSGWNIDRFDIPYLMNRMRRLQIDCRRLSDIYYAFSLFKQGEDFINQKIGGTSIMDLRALYKKITYDKKPDNYQLNTVSKLVLGEQKLNINIEDAWKNNRKLLLEYNKHDVQLCVKIDEKCKLIDYCLSIQEFIGAPIDYSLTNSKLIDYMILKKYHNKFVFPTANKFAVKEEFVGALTGKLIEEKGEWKTINPVAAIHKDVAVYDFSKMYVSIYQTYNICPSTIDPDGDIIIDDVRFTSKKIGLIPSLFEELIKKRKEIDNEREKLTDVDSIEYYSLVNKAGAVKAIGNSIYGIMGYEKFRLYDTRVAKSVTSVGRKLLIELNKTCKKLNYEVLYSDTDSSFVELKTGEVSEAIQLNEKINEDLKNWLISQGRPSNYISVECEKIFKSIIFMGVKKKYAGILKWKKGKMTTELFVRGMEILKRDTPNSIRPVLKQIFRDILEQKKVEEIKLYLREQKEKIKQLPLTEVGFTKNISKKITDYHMKAQHIEAVKFSNQYLKTNFHKNDMPKILYVKSYQYKTEVIAIDENTVIPTTIIVDYNKIFQNFIYKKIKMLEKVKGLESLRILSMKEIPLTSF